MKAKFVLLIAAGLFLATASQAQFPGSYKDSRDGNRDRQEMTHNPNGVSGNYRELRSDKRELRNDRRELKKHRRHHRHHGHRHAQRAF